MRLRPPPDHRYADERRITYRHWASSGLDVPSLLAGLSAYQGDASVLVAHVHAALLAALATPACVRAAVPMSRRARIGKIIIGLIVGAEVIYELTAFGDGPEGVPTESQLVKAYERAHGLVAYIAVGSALLGAAAVLFAHLVYPTF